MTSRRLLLTLTAVACASVLSFGGCGSSSPTSPENDSGASTTCVPGYSIACAGSGGCAGFQVCESGGSSYGLCDCNTDSGATGESDSGATRDSGAVADSGATGDSGDTGTDSPGSEAGTDGSLPDANVFEDGGDGGPWTPSALPGLAVWLEGDVGVAMDPLMPNHVKRWLDQSGNFNDATSVNTSGGEAVVDPFVIHGHDAILMACNGTFFDIANAPTLNWGTGDFSITFVANAPVASNSLDDDQLWVGSNLALSAAAGTFNLTVGTVSVTMMLPPSGSFGVVTARGASVRLDSPTQSSTGAVNTESLTSTESVTLGVCSGNDDPVLDIAEVVVTDTTLTDADLAKMYAYFQTKYGL